jgi:hypothetical protein
MDTSTMTDLELRLLHCEREPSVEALSSTADEYLSAGDVEMYEGLRHMAENRKMPWKSRCNYYFYSTISEACYDGLNWSIGSPEFEDNLTHDLFSNENTKIFKDTFANIVRWRGKRLIELDMV